MGAAAAAGWLLYAPKPVVDLRVLKDRNFALGCFAIGVFAVILYGSAVLIPQLAQEHLGYTATLAGLVLSPGAVGIILLIPIVGLIMPHVQTRFILALGFFSMGCGLLYSRTITPNIDFWHLIVLRGTQAMPLALLFVPASVLAYQTVPQRLQGDAAALFTMFRNVAGSIGISLSTALVTQRTQVHMAYLSNHLSQSSANFRNGLAQLTAAIRGLGTMAGRRYTDCARPDLPDLDRSGRVSRLHGRVPLLRAPGIRIRTLYLLVLAGEESRRRPRRSLMSGAKFIAVAAMTCVLLACKSVGPDFKAPQEPVPPSYVGTPDAAQPGAGPPHATAEEPPASFWWQQFHDQELDRLEDRAAAGNLDLKAAYLRIVESRIQVQSARAQGLPSLNGTASFEREQLGLAGILKSKGIATGAPGSAEAGLIASLEQPVNLYQLGFDASWELDLFGRVRRSVEAAQAQSAGAVETRNDLLVSLQAEVAETYFQLRAGQALRQITLDLIAAQHDIFELTQNRQTHGLASSADVETARAQWSSLQSQLPPYDQTIATARHALAVLLGETPAALEAEFEPGDLPSLPATVPVGVPSTLARRRPDIRSAGSPIARGHGRNRSLGCLALSRHLAHREFRIAQHGHALSFRLGQQVLHVWPQHFDSDLPWRCAGVECAFVEGAGRGSRSQLPQDGAGGAAGSGGRSYQFAARRSAFRIVARHRHRQSTRFAG